MKISVIVPVYNKEDYIEQCLDSIINQTYEGDMELILVDDESTDESGLICDRYAQMENKVLVIHQSNTGAAGAWRRGFEASSGDYICFVDSDDWIALDMLKKLAEAATGADEEIIMSDYVIEYENGTSREVYQTLAPGVYDRKQIIKRVIPGLWGYEDREVCMSRCMKLFSRKLIENNEHYSRSGLRFGEDNALTLPCVLDAKRIVVLDHMAMYHYRYVDSSVVHNYDPTLVPSIKLLQKVTEEMICDKFSGKDRNKLLRSCQREIPILLLYALRNEVRGDKDYYKNIQDICGPNGYKAIIAANPITVKQRANRLIYSVMKHPNRLMCMILRSAMIIWSSRG